MSALEINRARAAFEWNLLEQAAYSLDEVRREAVLNAIQEVCRFRGYILLAVHVRATHVHSVVDADASPERVMNDFKSYASRWLNQLDLDGPNRRRWTRHGSTRWLWEQEDLSAAIQYVVAEQGEPMSVFESADV
jgi:REP element-mobilizing transposase RayT